MMIIFFFKKANILDLWPGLQANLLQVFAQVSEQ